MEKPEPTLRDKAVSGANYGMLAGFWAELPVVTFFAFKQKPQEYWNGLRNWSAKLVLPATLVGLIYGWTKPQREADRLERDTLRSQHITGETDAENGKSWVAAELARGQPTERISRY